MLCASCASSDGSLPDALMLTGPIHRQRSHHVELGGKGLQDFAEGMSEAEMDALVESWR